MLKDFTRGGQTTLHHIHMAWQILKKLLLVFVLVFALFCSFWYWHGYRAYPYHFSVLGSWISAKVRVSMNNGKDPMPFENIYHQTAWYLPQTVLNLPMVNAAIADLRGYFLTGIWRGLILSIATALFCMQLFYAIGNAQRRCKFIRGIRLVDNSLLIKQLKEADKASDLRLAGVPIVKGTECSHFLITGSSGSGKTVCMMELLDQVRACGQRAIIYDKMGVFVKHYYREGKDIILNPLDERCPPWHIWAECLHTSDYDTLAASMMPLPLGHADPFWINGARTIFSATAIKLAERGQNSMKALAHYLFAQDLSALSHLLTGTEAETLVSERSAKTALSIKSVLATYLKSFKYLKEVDMDKPVFSIRDWVANDNADSWLFVSSRADKHESLKPLISAWLEIAGNALMSLGQNDTRRVWMCLDELPSLHRLLYLSAMMAESRQFGGCLVTAMQSIAQLRDIYGSDASEAMAGLCNTRIFFHTPETRTAAWISKTLGEGEWDEPREGFSYGANTIRDGVSLNRQRIVRPVILDTEIMGLNKLEAYLRLPGDWPVTQLMFKPKERIALADAFIPMSLTKAILAKKEKDELAVDSRTILTIDPSLPGIASEQSLAKLNLESAFTLEGG